jgi:hypothetical protein
MKYAFALIVAALLSSLAEASQPDCGEQGSRWLADFEVNGTGSAPKVVVAIDRRLNLEVTEEVNFTIVVRDRITGADIFGSSPHAGDAYRLSAADVRVTRQGEVLSTNNVGNVISLPASVYGGTLIIDARALYSTREDDSIDRLGGEWFSRGVLHVCWKIDGE